MDVHKWILASVLCATASVAIVDEAAACGTFVPVEGETASLDAQRVIMAYDETTNTTRVVAQIGFVGELTEFSWIIPLPAEPTNVQALGDAGAQLFTELDEYGAPRFGVSYCGFNNGGGDGQGVDGEVTVLQTGSTGAFEYVVLTGTSGSVVTDWLRNEGYGISEAITEVAHTYIREGSVFMAMKVNAEALGGEGIDPAIRFDYEGWPGYPLRIAQPTTTDELEIILSVIAPQAVTVNRQQELGGIEWFNSEPQYLESVRAANGWVVEHRGVIEGWYGGSWGGLDVPVTEDLEQLLREELGVDLETQPVLTRLHGVFTPGALSQDAEIVLDEEVYQFGGKVHQLYVCDEPGEGGVSSDSPEVAGSSSPGNDESAGETGDGGCSTAAGSPADGMLMLVFGLLVGAARRRS